MPYKNEAPTDAEYNAALLIVCRSWAAGVIDAIDCDKEDADENGFTESPLEVTEEVIQRAVCPLSNDDEVPTDDWNSADLGTYQLVCTHYGVTPALDYLPFKDL